MPKDFYAILGIKKDASEDEIKKSFRRLAHENRPERGGDQIKYRELIEAYTVLMGKKPTVKTLAIALVAKPRSPTTYDLSGQDMFKIDRDRLDVALASFEKGVTLNGTAYPAIVNIVLIGGTLASATFQNTVLGIDPQGWRDLVILALIAHIVLIAIVIIRRRLGQKEVVDIHDIPNEIYDRKELIKLLIDLSKK